MMLQGKKIILGITGSIAAYKSAQIVRLLVKEGAEVKVIMTSLAKEFITPLTLATLSKSPILVDFFDPTNGNWNSHVNLGLWADAYLIAPATANTIAKMANGVADNLLITTYLSAKCPVFVAPAMDLDMFIHPSTQRNLDILTDYGNHIIEPASGELASGLDGKGRMEEPENIVQVLDDFFTKKDLVGNSILITAGPTYEMLDPVRFIGNYSSGKMGFALAEECAKRGAKVYLIAGPVSLKCTHPNIERINVQSAKEMHDASVKLFDTMNGAILCAAVADYKPKTQSEFKLKREKEAMTLELLPTSDIAAALGMKKKDNQFLVGFALETNNEEKNAKDKLERKKLDFIVLNSLQDSQTGFGYNTNKISIIHKNGQIENHELKSKKAVATDIVDTIVKLF